MKIIKYKKLSGNKYKVFLDNNDIVILHEDIILKYNLLITKEINNINEITDDNNRYLIYDNVLKYISTKMRCESEIRSYLNKKQIDGNLEDEIVMKLKQNGYINDRLYAKSYISDKVRLNKYGLNKIKSDLKKLKIDENIIDEELKNIDSDAIENNLNKLIDKMIKSNRKYSGDVLKQKILIDLINKGYSKESVTSILENKELNNDDLYDTEYDKLYNKYKTKYEGEQLEYFIKQKLYQRGIKKMQ